MAVWVSGKLGGGDDKGQLAGRISVAAFAMLSLAYSFAQVGGIGTVLVSVHKQYAVTCKQ